MYQGFRPEKNISGSVISTYGTKNNGGREVRTHSAVPRHPLIRNLKQPAGLVHVDKGRLGLSGLVQYLPAEPLPKLEQARRGCFRRKGHEYVLEKKGEGTIRTQIFLGTNTGDVMLTLYQPALVVTSCQVQGKNAHFAI